MNIRRAIPVGIVGVLATVLVSVAGCAQNRPCMIIPAQIELARQKRDKAREEYESKLAELTRSQNNLEVSASRLDRLREERDELRTLLGEAPEGGN